MANLITTRFARGTEITEKAQSLVCKWIWRNGYFAISIDSERKRVFLSLLLSATLASLSERVVKNRSFTEA